MARPRPRAAPADRRHRPRCAAGRRQHRHPHPGGLHLRRRQRGGEAAVRRDAAGDRADGEDPQPDLRRRLAHTDTTGTPQVNQALSEKRAAAVATYLAGHGVAKARIASQGLWRERAALQSRRRPRPRRRPTAGSRSGSCPTAASAARRRNAAAARPLRPRRSRRARRAGDGRSAARRCAGRGRRRRPWDPRRAKRSALIRASDDRRGAHRARLQRHPQSAFVEPRGAELRRRGADRLHLGMGGRVGRPAHRVARFGDDLVAERDDRADRHFAGRGGFARQGRARGASAGAAGKLIGARLARRRSAELSATARCWWPARPGSAGGCTSSAGTLTVVCLVPTLTEPVSTSNAGAWPPLAVTPLLRRARSAGAWPPRIWLMSRKPVATAAMIATTARMRIKDDGAHVVSRDLA